jgi:uncharacterized membrane protein YfcA
MLRVTAWTVGLFGAGAAIAHEFPSRWVQPIVLLVLGFAFLFVSARIGDVKAGRPVAKLPARAPAPATQAALGAREGVLGPGIGGMPAAPAAVPVEQSA